MEEARRGAHWRTLDVIGEIAGETGKSYAQISLNWLLRQPGMVAPILGARRLDQIEDNIGAAGWELSEEQVARLSGVSAPPDLFTRTTSSGVRSASDTILV